MIVVSEAIRLAREALGVDTETVAEAAGVEPGKLIAYESGAENIPGDVLWRLSDTLGVPLEDLDSPAALRRHLDVMAVRFRADQQAVPERVRLAVARAGSAGRDYVELEEIRGRGSRYQHLIERWPRAPALPRHETWKSGRDLA